jgi:hypothetical protein
MDYCINTTPLINPITWANYAPYQPKGSFKQITSDQTQFKGQTSFVTAKSNLIDFFTAATGPSAPTAYPISKAAPSVEPTRTLTESTPPYAASDLASPLNVEIDQIAKQRVRLMAVKYASGAQSLEIVARLDILNSRLSERAPLVSKEQVAALEDANDQLARIRAAREERAKRLGISSDL